MRICLIGPGILPIPPNGWGAVEILIWDYYQELTKQGHFVDIINHIRSCDKDQSDPYTDYCQNLIKTINSIDYDFVHLHYDCLYHILPYIHCSKKGITSHYPYIDQIHRHASDGFDKIFNFIMNNQNFNVFCIAKKDKETIVQNGANPNKIFFLQNGANENLFKFNTSPNLDKTICLGKIEERKRQSIISSLLNIDFVGSIVDHNFITHENYLGEWNKETLYENLTNYTNMILISQGEADPLVLKEGMMAGLGIVISENLSTIVDINQPFIDVIQSNKIHDLSHIQSIINKNKQNCKQYRSQIREYALENFSYKKIITDYIHILEQL